MRVSLPQNAGQQQPNTDFFTDDYPKLIVFEGNNHQIKREEFYAARKQ
jgi:hypothetical protein